MKSNSSDLFLLNNTGNKSKQMLVDMFVVRDNELQEQIAALRRSAATDDPMSTLVIGQRGAGKTTLLHRVKYAVEDDPDLSLHYVPVIFKEEQYHLSDLSTLWESLGQSLDEYLGGSAIVHSMDFVIDSDKNEEKELFDIISSELISRGQRILLFFENLNVFLAKLSANERSKFREILISGETICLIASSTTYTDNRIDFSIDFYSFFKIVTLRGLTRAECERLLIKIGSLHGYSEQIRNIINNSPSRVESLRRLTGGNPRTISYLFQIFLDNSNGKAIKDLYILIDTLTFLYKAELDQLSAQQQKVIDVIAKNWDAMPVKDISKATRLESKNVSTILAGLEKNQLIETVKTSTKNNLYRIKERFLNIWYLMRFGRKHDKNNVVWLVRFFDAWCDETELAKRVKDHISDLTRGMYDEEAAIDIGNTFLSCENLSPSMKIQLLEATKSALGDRMYRKLQPSGKLLSDVFENHVRSGNYELALKALEDMPLKEIERNGFLSFLYLSKHDFHKSADFAKRVLDLDPDNAAAALTLGIIHEENLHDIDQAKFYYEKAIAAKSMHPYAATRLGDLFYKYERDLEQAREYHELAIRKGLKRSYLFLGNILREEGAYEEAEENLDSAALLNLEGVNLEFAKLYADKGDTRKALRYFEKSIEKNEENALVNFANWYRYRRRPQYSKAVELYRTAIRHNQIDAYHLLGELYADELKDYDKAIEVLNEGVKLEDANSAHELGHVFLSQNKPELAITYFVKSYQQGRKTALFCMAEGVYIGGFSSEKESVLHILMDHSAHMERYALFDLLLARMLLWNDDVVGSLAKFEQWCLTVLPSKIDDTDNTDDGFLKSMIRQLSSFLLLLIAKGGHKQAYHIFGDRKFPEIRSILRPVYFVLMEELKHDFPLEYLKAGDEYADTIKEIKQQIKYLKKQVLN